MFDTFKISTFFHKGTYGMLFLLLTACGGGTDGGNTTDQPSTTSNVKISEAHIASHNVDRLLIAQNPTYVSNGGVLGFFQSTQSVIYPTVTMYSNFNTNSGLLDKVGVNFIDSQLQATSSKYQCGPDTLSPYSPNDLAHNFPCTSATSNINAKTIKLIKQKMWMIDELGNYITGANGKSIVVDAEIK